MTKIPKLDSVFHQQVRTRLAVLLSLQPQSFSQLKAKLELTDGNLDAHLRKLAAAGYLHSSMVTEPRPGTLYQLSPTGQQAFKNYTKALVQIVKMAG